MLNCHDATRLMSEKLDRKLGRFEALNLRFHLMMCQGCKNFDTQMAGMRQLTRAYVKGKGVSAALPPEDSDSQ